MRSLALALALSATAVLAGGCGNSCQDLGSRLCDCTPAGTTKTSCVDTVKADIQRLNPNKDVQQVCEEKLQTCYARTDPQTQKEIDFCDWIDGRCGKAACGISSESYADLSGYEADGTTPITPSPDDPAVPLCPK